MTDPTGFRPWLFSIAHSTMVDAQRREMRKKRWGSRAPAEELGKLASAKPPPAEAAAREESRQRSAGGAAVAAGGVPAASDIAIHRRRGTTRRLAGAGPHQRLAAGTAEERHGNDATGNDDGQ